MHCKVSVIVPAYNAEAYLPACIESLCAQTLREIEILIVDDGSVDGTGAMADGFAAQDERIRVIHQENRGLSGARNSGIEAATGEYLGFVDADDWVDPRMFEKLYDAAVSLQSEVVTCGTRVITADGSPHEPILPKCPLHTRLDPQQVRRLMPQLVRDGFLPYVWRRLYAARLFRQEGIRSDTRYGVCEDATFCLECLLRADGIAAIADELYDYRFVAGSLMHKKAYNPHLTNALLLQYRVKTELCRAYMPGQETEMRSAFAADTADHIACLVLNNLYRKKSGRYLEFRRAARSPLLRDMYRCIPLRTFRSRSLDLLTLYCIGLRLYLPAFCIGNLVFGKDIEE